MDKELLYNAVVTILSAIITGGFVLVYVEIGNRKNRKNDNYERLMRPFLKKLTAYFKFVCWCSISCPKNGMSNAEKEFKKVTEELSRYGGQAIISGGNYEVDYFSANELYELNCNKINHLWYLHDRNTLSHLSLNYSTTIENEIRKELTNIKPEYALMTIDLNRLAIVSGDFFCEIYQPVESDTYYYESSMKLYRIHTLFVLCSVLFVLLLICMMLCIPLTDLFLKLSTIIIICMLALSILMLGIDEKKQIKWLFKINKLIHTINLRIKHCCKFSIKKYKFEM
ncbi:MAG: hypothetical protein MJ010_02560 [Paludibacteraceae bacterium]|nr:hypothetical protein [Paludibacteraceae bacterium]